MLTIENASNPVWNENKTAIILSVKFQEFNVPFDFGATPIDPMPYGIELYNRALNGEFGPIAEYVPPPPAEIQPTVEGAQTL